MVRLVETMARPRVKTRVCLSDFAGRRLIDIRSWFKRWTWLDLWCSIKQSFAN
ncbi:MAG TPA: hypothetical protein VHE78_09245 [Gemmatimonadaceae bacterium]|nr:hypothetical protein [Gemmatimonadaceae bacterium]